MQVFWVQTFLTQRLPSPNFFKRSVPGLRIFRAFASLLDSCSQQPRFCNLSLSWRMSYNLQKIIIDTGTCTDMMSLVPPIIYLHLKPSFRNLSLSLGRLCTNMNYKCFQFWSLLLQQVMEVHIHAIQYFSIVLLFQVLPSHMGCCVLESHPSLSKWCHDGV